MTYSDDSAVLRAFGAELLGTTVLMIVGPGSAILAGDTIGTTGVALSFGFALLAMAYSIGHVSGCHINPAVTLGFLVVRKVSLRRAVHYWVAQLAGGALGGFILWSITERGDLDQTGIFFANGWGSEIGSSFNVGSAITVEIVFTALLVFVVLSTTKVGFPSGFGGLAAGFTLAMVHLATIPVDNTSVNPARSFGTAIFSGGDAIEQLWIFLLFPMVGALVGILAWVGLNDASLEDTLLADERLMYARDRADELVHKIEEELD